MKGYIFEALLSSMAVPASFAWVGGRGSVIGRSLGCSSSRLPRRAGYVTAAGHSTGDAPNKKLILPELCVFDLDMCLWSPEMYELSQV